MPSDDFRQHLEPGERLVGSGRPRRGLVIRAVDLILIPFSLFWLGIVGVFLWFLTKQTTPLPEGEGGMPI